MAKKKMRHRGLRAYRFEMNPEEKRFAEAWEWVNVHGNALDHLLDEREVQGGKTPSSSERDRVVAATVVQWLGSPVGQSWLGDLGYERQSGRAKPVSVPRRQAKR